MTTTKKKAKEAAEMLLDMQRRHDKLAKKMEAARAKLQKRMKKLRKVETKIAHLEQAAHPPLLAANGQAVLVPAAATRPVKLIFNPKSGLTKKTASLEELVGILRRHGLEPEVIVKTTGKMARAAAKAAAKNDEEMVIAAGGDGTIEDVATQLTGTKTALGILPIGTRNNLARELGIPLDLDQACAMLAAGITRKIDVGRVCAAADTDIEYFLESAGIGLSAIVLPAGQQLRKGRLAKLPGALRRLFEFKPGPIEVELDNGEKVTAHSSMVTVSNAPLLGMNYMVAPDAKMDDGQLDVAVYDGMTPSELTAYFLKTVDGKRSYNPNVRFYRARKVIIRSSQPLPAAADAGAIEERKVVEIDVMPECLHAIVGKGIALTLPVEAVQSTPPLAGDQGAPKNGSAMPEEATGTEAALAK